MASTIRNSQITRRTTGAATPTGQDPGIPELDILRLGQALQSSLDISRLLERFYSAVRKHVDIDGIEYRNDERSITCPLGVRSRNTCSYDLELDQQFLGRVLFRRRRPFTEKQLGMLESMLCALLYPLRNALSYHDALQAARKDALTGAWNRAAMDEALQRALCLARRHRSPLAALMMDLDHFKRINDRFGHACGDQALRSVVDCIRNCIRGSDELFRYGGEEFVLLLPNTDRQGALLLADRIRRCIAGGRHVCEDGDMRLTVSIGVTAMKRGDTPDRLLQRADRAMYEAKAAGRNKVASA